MLIVLELEDLGFGPYFATQLDHLEGTRPGLVPARIAADGAGIYHLLGCQARLGELSGRLRHELSGIGRPAVGDWVAVADDAERAVIHQVLRRRTAMIRRGLRSRLAEVTRQKTSTLAAIIWAVASVSAARRTIAVRRRKT